MVSEPIYTQQVSEAFKALETSPHGLESGEIEARRSLYGVNQLTEPPPEPIW